MDPILQLVAEARAFGVNMYSVFARHKTERFFFGFHQFEDYTEHCCRVFKEFFMKMHNTFDRRCVRPGARYLNRTQ